MKETRLFSALFPAHPDLLPILQNIREKYGIQEFTPDANDGLTEALINNSLIDWQAVHHEIEEQIRNHPELLPKNIQIFLNGFRNYRNNSLDFPELEELRPELREQIKALMMLFINLLDPVFIGIDEQQKVMADLLFEYLITGKTREVPETWFSVVTTMQMMGNPVVLAMASQAADPKVVAEEFKKEFTKQFGKDRPNITDKNLRSAEYLRMKLEGKSPAYLVELYEKRHPSEFPIDNTSKEYKKAVQKHKEMMKKRIERLQDDLDKILQDKK